MQKSFNYSLKVYYEDTDAGGIVYYANYLKFLERARSEAIYSLGLSNKKLLEDHKILITVKSCNIEYKKPALFEDIIQIKSLIKSISKTSFVMKQSIFRNEELISEADVILVTINEKGKPVRIPSILINALN